MTDRNKIMSNLQTIRLYHSLKKHSMAVAAIDDVVALLKKQEPVVATWYQVDGVFGLEDGYKCGECSGEIERVMRYCPWCGRKVEWND